MSVNAQYPDSHDSLACKRTFLPDTELEYFSVRNIMRSYPDVQYWPAVKLVLLENLLRHEDGSTVTADLIHDFLQGRPSGGPEIPFFPARLLMQDYAGISALVDFAGLRDEVQTSGGKAVALIPALPVDLVVDHSLQVVNHGIPNAALLNLQLEYRGNWTRYEFLRWAEQSIAGLRVVPPGRGIVHQVNIEALTTGARITNKILHLDTVLGTDSHTPMVNGLGVLGWGVGGIEALAVMLGQPVWLANPRIVGIELVGRPGPGVFAADVALNLAKLLRDTSVVGAFLEFFGPGVDCLSVFDRTTIANMTPEYGATCSLFPTTEHTLRYFERTHKRRRAVSCLRGYLSEMGLLADKNIQRNFDEVLRFDLSAVSPSIAGPSRPHDVFPVRGLKAALSELGMEGFPGQSEGSEPIKKQLTDGVIGLAAITSCTNTANPKSMIAAGLVAKKAVELGLSVPLHVKCSLTPGSLAVTRYLAQLELLEPLERLGFYVAGYGCATCVGNSGELHPDVQAAIVGDGIRAVAALSGNRNFESRIHPRISANFLMSPPLVVAIAIAGSANIDMEVEPLGVSNSGAAVYLTDLMPADEVVENLYENLVNAQSLTAKAAELFAPSANWHQLHAKNSANFPWKTSDTYFQRPVYLRDLLTFQAEILCLPNMRVLLVLGDDITTDHISPVGRISNTSEAGIFLKNQGVTPENFNTFGARRGNANVMIRGTFDNPRLKNELIEAVGPMTVLETGGKLLSIFQASREISNAGMNGIIIAGKNYGSGSARDWAAKGQRLLGIRAVIAESFERIHKTNLLMFGVAPIIAARDVLSRLKASVRPESIISVDVLDSCTIRPQVSVLVLTNGVEAVFECVLQTETSNEYKLAAAGGLLGIFDQGRRQKH